MMRTVALVILALCGLIASLNAHADLDALVVRALGPVDGRAVVSTADGRMHVLHVGDTVPGTRAVVRQVLSDRLVVEIPGNEGARPATAWIYRAHDGESRLRRMSRERPTDEEQGPTTSTVAGEAEGDTSQ